MSRTVYIVRHGTSEGNRDNQASFGPEGGPLNEQGIREAKNLYRQFQELGFDPQTEPVASSNMKRAYQTAQFAGFRNINRYATLNEVGRDVPREVRDAMIARNEVPPIVNTTAQTLLKIPPKENIWFTHGQLIAGIAHELGIPPTTLFIPEMGSITKLELP
jgi:hypothetical protein